MKTGFKAFNKGLKCRDLQYEENKEYKIKCTPVLCENGFHYCENPLDTLDYYDLCDSEFAEIEDHGKSETDGNKTVTNHIKIKAKLDFKGFVKASIDFLFEKIKIDDKIQAASGNYSQLAASGDSSQLAASGYSSKLAASGDYSQLEMTGEKSVGANIGENGIAKGKIGCWITLAEYDNERNPICVKSAKIDGKKLKADTWYALKDKKFTEI